MSTLNVSNISDGTDTVGTSYVLNGSAKSWVNFQGTSTVTIRESLNISSITDVANGIYQANFSSGMTSANYAALLGSNSMVYDQGTLQDTTTSTYVGIKVQDGSVSSFIDAAIVTAGTYGDLA